jgi:hypothetical protein
MYRPADVLSFDPNLFRMDNHNVGNDHGRDFGGSFDFN